MTYHENSQVKEFNWKFIENSDKEIETINSNINSTLGFLNADSTNKHFQVELHKLSNEYQRLTKSRFEAIKKILEVFETQHFEYVAN